jgi:hypothetical protein
VPRARALSGQLGAEGTLAMIDILVRFGIFLVIITLMLVTIETVIPTQGTPVSKYGLEYLTRKNDLRPGPNPIQVRAP